MTAEEYDDIMFDGWLQWLSTLPKEEAAKEYKRAVDEAIKDADHSLSILKAIKSGKKIKFNVDVVDWKVRAKV